MPWAAAMPATRSPIELPTLTGGPSGKPGEVHDAGLALHDQVVAGPVRLGPALAEARDRAVDEPGVRPSRSAS